MQGALQIHDHQEKAKKILSVLVEEDTIVFLFQKARKKIKKQGN